MKDMSELVNNIHQMETKVQLLKNQVDDCNDEIKEFSKVNNIYPVNMDEVKGAIEELILVTEKMNKQTDLLKKINKEIAELEDSANAQINHENYDKLILAKNELEERENEKVDVIYNYKLRNLNNQNKVLKVLKVARNLSICLGITFLILRNHIFKIQMNNLATNFSFLAICLVFLILLCEYQYKNNKKKFDEIEAAYNNNNLQIQMLQNDINYILSAAECSSVEEFEQKLFNLNNYELEKITQLTIEKDNIREAVNIISEKKSKLNKSVYETIISANIKFDFENVWSNFDDFQFTYELYELCKKELTTITDEFNDLMKQYRRLAKIYWNNNSGEEVTTVEG